MNICDTVWLLVIDGGGLYGLQPILIAEILYLINDGITDRVIPGTSLCDNTLGNEYLIFLFVELAYFFMMDGRRSTVI